MSGRGFVRLGVSGFLADEVLAAQAGKARRIRLRHLRPAGRFGKRGLCRMRGFQRCGKLYGLCLGLLERCGLLLDLRPCYRRCCMGGVQLSGSLLACIGVLGAQPVSVGMRPIQLRAKVGGPVFDFGNAGICLVGPAHGLGQLLANVGQLLRLLLGRYPLGGQCSAGRCAPSSIRMAPCSAVSCTFASASR